MSTPDKREQIRALRAKAASTTFPHEAEECRRLADKLEAKHGANPVQPPPRPEPRVRFRPGPTQADMAARRREAAIRDEFMRTVGFVVPPTSREAEILRLQAERMAAREAAQEAAIQRLIAEATRDLTVDGGGERLDEIKKVAQYFGQTSFQRGGYTVNITWDL